MVKVSVTFTCDTCGKEKTVEKKMNYSLYQQIEYGELPEKFFIPKNWGYGEKTATKFELDCNVCLKKWWKENEFNATVHG